MRRKRASPVPGGDLERALLGCIWARGNATARELHDELGASRRIVYTTVAKVLDRLVDKGLLRRTREGRAFRYTPRTRQQTTQRALARGLMEHLAGGDPRPAVAALVGALEDVSPDLLDELETELRRRRRRGA